MRTLITGGAGTLGQEITSQLFKSDPKQVVVIYSRDEGKQAAMAREFPDRGRYGCRYFLGDIRDTARLSRAMAGVDRVVHAAASKMIDLCETNSHEAVSVNVEGTKSVANACISAGVQRALFISTDKAPDSVSVYGTSKRMAEQLWIASNSYGPCSFSAVRYGNVIGSNKSVFHAWAAARENGEKITLTSAEATRFFWSIKDAGKFCLKVLNGGFERGLIHIPAMKSYRMIDIARKYSPKPKVTGYRCPEKDHETLWTDWEAQFVRYNVDHYQLYPMIHSWCGDYNMPGEEQFGALRSGDPRCLTDEIGKEFPV